MFITIVFLMGKLVRRQNNRYGIMTNSTIFISINDASIALLHQKSHGLVCIQEKQEKNTIKVQLTMNVFHNITLKTR